MKKLIVILIAFLLVAFLIVQWLGRGGLGSHWGAGTPTAVALSAEIIAERAHVQKEAALDIGVARPKQILFGDLHVHSTFSLDAFIMALPTSGGEGAHPVSDACDFARHCSALDFWSINDHAIGLDQRAWDETVEAIRQCNEIAGDPANPDVTAYLGWEWTQMGTNPDNHYGHKNVILRGLEDSDVPVRPIAARAPLDAFDRQADTALPGPLAMGGLALMRPNRDTFDLIRYFDTLANAVHCPDGVPVRDLPVDCRESTMTPRGLFDKLDDWGFDSMVIPHGTTWGFYTPQGSAWDKQLENNLHDPLRQRLIEIYSGHGNSEEYRNFREVVIAADGSKSCPSARNDFLPSCWRAGEIIATRCMAEGESKSECKERAAVARQNYVDADLMGHLTVPGVKTVEWKDSGQCRDCFQPSFNYRPKSSAQYILALRNFDEPGEPKGFHFGFMASSDNHTSRPGTGYKEYGRTYNTEALLTGAGERTLGDLLPVTPKDPGPYSEAFDPNTFGGAFFNLRESERGSSFFLTGGLIAVHSPGRGRDEIWQAMEQREVYGTSGPRILLWFDLLNAPGIRGGRLPMGGAAELSQAPIFQVRATGSFVQKPGCPEESQVALGEEGIERLCRGDCYNPDDERRGISRIEVVRIRPQIEQDEPIDPLIEDAWRVFQCDPDPAGCSVSFTDPEFETSGRDVIYYARAIEAPSMAVNAGGLRCVYNDKGECLETNACPGSTPASDECMSETEQRAWSSPITVGWAQ